MPSRKKYMERLRKRRNELNMGTEYVAEQLNCSAATILAYERGDRIPPLGRIKPLAELYGMSIEAAGQFRICPDTRILIKTT